MKLTRKGEVLYLIAKGKTGHRVQAAISKQERRNLVLKQYGTNRNIGY
jgi:hypothetical protein